MQNALISTEWQRIWVYKSFKTEIQKGGASNSDILPNWFPEKLGPTFLIAKKLQKPQKATP